MTIYEIKRDMLELLEIAQDPDIDPQIIADTMEGLEAELKDKAEGYVIVIKELESQEAKFDQELTRISRVKKTISGNIERMKERLLTALQETGIDKLPTEHFTLSVAKNGGLAPLVYDKEVPQEYTAVTITPDTKKIREELKNGKLDFVHLGERGVHLGIK